MKNIKSVVNAFSPVRLIMILMVAGSGCATTDSMLGLDREVDVLDADVANANGVGTVRVSDQRRTQEQIVRASDATARASVTKPNWRTFDGPPLEAPPIERERSSRFSANKGAQQTTVEPRRRLATSNSDEIKPLHSNPMTIDQAQHERFHRLAIIADQQGRHHEAETLYVKSLKINPLNADALNDLGYCYYLQERVAEAEAALAAAAALSPSDLRVHNNLGLVYAHQGQRDRALESFRQAGSEADAQHNLAVIMASFEADAPAADSPSAARQSSLPIRRLP